MSYDIPSVSELEAVQLLNKHYAEVITSKKDGIASGLDITRTTNPITGVTRRTLYKILDDMDETFLERLLKMAFTPVGTFTAGATLTDARQTLLWEVSEGGDGRYYSWAGSFPKIVAPSSSPSEPEWVDRTDDSLRDEIRETVFQNMKRLAAEAGYNLVDGSFQTGAVTVNQNDVVWDWSSGKYYGGVIGSVSAGSTPATTGGVGAWVDRTNLTLRSDISDQYSQVVISGVYAKSIASLRKGGITGLDEYKTALNTYAEAMDLALSDLTCSVIKVPNGITLGKHSITRDIVIYGGRGVVFDESVQNAGFSIEAGAEDVSIIGFRNTTLSRDAAKSHRFVRFENNAKLYSLIVTNNEITGGINGISVGLENGRSCNNVTVMNNSVKDAVGTNAGYGYGIHYANDNDFGSALIANNVTDYCDRHSIYIARNKPLAGPISIINNVVKNHRASDRVSDHSNPRCAFNVLRSSNVTMINNKTIGGYDGALMFDSDSESPLVYPSFNNLVKKFTINAPLDSQTQIFVGYVSPQSYVTVDVKIEDVYMDSSNPAALMSLAYGNLTLIEPVINYSSLSSNINVMVIGGNSDLNSKIIIIKNARIVADMSAGELRVYRLSGGSATGSVPMRFESARVTLKSAGRYILFSSGVTVTNQNIEVYGNQVNLSFTPKAVNDPSSIAGQLIARVSNAAIATPNTFITPNYIGDELWLSTTSSYWKAKGLANTDWIQIG